MVTNQIINQFFSRVDKSQGPLGCWLWDRKAYKGYGSFKVKRKTFKAHRFSYGLMYGDQTGKLICHNCDVRLCVNPLHLYAGTAQENSNDRKMRGSYVVKNKLTKYQVEKIRFLHKTGSSMNFLHKKFSVARTTIKKIITNKTWVLPNVKHLN